MTSAERHEKGYIALRREDGIEYARIVQFRDGWRVCPLTTARQQSRKGWPTAVEAARSFYGARIAKIVGGARMSPVGAQGDER